MENAKQHKWEYKVERRLTEFELGDLGMSGWELVAINGGTMFAEHFYLKRPL